MKVNNKEKIFEVSVNLFSEHGYDGVSIRQIAHEVGIKESSIYNHYKSKEDILDSILQYYIFEMTRDEIPVEKANENLDVSMDYFYREGLELYKSKLSEPKMMKITRIILVEAYHNDNIRNFLKSSMIDGPVSGWVQLFELMKQKGLIQKDADSKQLAESFFYYGFFLLMEHFIINYPEDDEAFLDELAIKSEKHMKLILQFGLK